jgi:hypothetical protein
MPDDDVDLVIEAVEIGLARVGREILVGAEARFQPRARIRTQLLRLGLEIAGDARKDRLALGSADAQRRAMTDVFSMASGKSSNSLRMSAAGLIQASEEDLTRSSRSTWLD